MTEYLLFQLYGPLQSWGDVAVGEIRPDVRAPTKSAVLGLLAAALGVRRDEEERHAQMANAYGLAVRHDVKGIPLRDYHTVQTASARKGRVYRCRADLLGGMLETGEGLNTIVTYRDYTADACFSVCIWTREDDPPYPLSELAEALRQPRFTPYLGRKSCPLGLPFSPQLTEAESVGVAFASYPVDGRVAKGLSMDSKGTVEMSWDADGDAGVAEDRVESIRDAPLSRRRWQFTVRDKSVGTTECPLRREWE